jgi:hypothetical protein
VPKISFTGPTVRIEGCPGGPSLSRAARKGKSTRDRPGHLPPKARFLWKGRAQTEDPSGNELQIKTPIVMVTDA